MLFGFLIGGVMVDLFGFKDIFIIIGIVMMVVVLIVVFGVKEICIEE